MNINIKDIRARLSNNTAIDAKEIQALCDEVEAKQERIYKLESDRNRANEESDYYREQLAKSHEILGRVVHQTSERWDSVNLTEYYPTDNLHRQRSINNPSGSKTTN